ncbi:hypothetical protein JCM8097_004249 [Rhodosporidiobolus ruineniae]
MPLPRALSFSSLSSAAATPAPPSADSADAHSSPSTAGGPSLLASPSEPTTTTSRNRKKRAQKKKAKARRQGASHDDDRDEDSAPDVEADDDIPFLAPSKAPSALQVGADSDDDAPDADEDESYLERHQAARGAISADAADEAVALPSTPEAVKEAVEAAARRRLAESKQKKASKPLSPANPIRVQLPPGAGQVEGMPELRSTPERRKKLEEAGFVPLTDERGMLRMGVAVGDGVVLVHQSGGKEPIMLRL